MVLYLYIFGSVLIVSLLAMIGIVFLFLSPNRLKSVTMFLVGLSAGTLLADATLHLIPEAIIAQGMTLSVWLSFMAGIIVFFILEKIIHWHHCHLDPDACEHIHAFGIINIVGDTLHNFIDGAVIAGSFIISIPLGISTTIAVVAHEIPHEIGNMGVLLHAGYSRRKALSLNFLTALVAFLGASSALLLVNISGFTNFIIPFTAGNFVYIATTDLIPELKLDTKLSQTALQLISITIGAAVMLWLKAYSS